jgi:hypothetical protein
MDANRTPNVKPRITDESEKVKTWKLADIVDNGHLRALHLTDTDMNPSKVRYIVIELYSLIMHNQSDTS